MMSMFGGGHCYAVMMSMLAAVPWAVHGMREKRCTWAHMPCLIG